MLPERSACDGKTESNHHRPLLLDLFCGAGVEGWRARQRPSADSESLAQSDARPPEEGSAVSGEALYERRRHAMLFRGIRLRRWAELPPAIRRRWDERAAALTPEQVSELTS